MTILETAKVTSKGQVTIPSKVRKVLHIREGSSVAFGVSKKGVVLMPCKVTVESPYTAKEWGKIEALASKEGKSYKTAKEAKEYINAL